MYLIDEIKEQQQQAYSNLCKTRNYKQLSDYTKKRKNTLTGLLHILLAQARRRAIDRNLRFNLSLGVLIDLYKAQQGLCALSGVKLTHTNVRTKRISPFNISIDRIDSSKGYTKDNIQLVCACINLMKLDHSTTEFIELCKTVTKFNV